MHTRGRAGSRRRVRYMTLGNDPGQPGKLNANYDPSYQTIGTTFEATAGVVIPVDLAPMRAVADTFVVDGTTADWVIPNQVGALAGMQSGAHGDTVSAVQAT
jgi:hypothetical protein